MISFWQAPNIQDKVVWANHSGYKSYQPILPLERNSYIAYLINHSKTVTNTVSNKTCYIEGGNANTVRAIDSAVYPKYKKLYFGQTSQSLKKRFNNNDNENDCEIRHALEISVLEHATGSSDYMKHKKDKWIMRLKTYSPLG